MSTYDLTAASSSTTLAAGPAGFSTPCEGFSYRVKGVIDLSKISTTLASGDIVKAINVPAGAIVKSVHVRVITTCSAAMTVSAGDSSATAGWIALTALNQTAGTVLPPTGALLNTGAGKAYTSTDYVALVVGGSTFSNTGIFEVTARIERLY